MTRQERVQKWMKKHKKRAAKHTVIGAVFACFFMMGLNLLDQVGASSVPRDQNARITIGMVGDMMFGRNIELIGEKYGYEHLFKQIQPYLNHADVMTGNFENAITKRNGHYSKADKFIHLKTKPYIAKVLKKVGFKTLNLANNHIKDYGQKGLLDTVEVLKSAQIDTVGAGEDIRRASKVSYRTVNGMKIAILGISDVLPRSFGARKDRSGALPAKPDIYLPLVSEAKANADLVLIHVHWGLEYDSGFHPRQKDIGHALIDAGADVVIGHHPHVLEPVEKYKGGVILYSMGNFIFDQGWSRTKESVLAYLKVLHDGKLRLELHPVFIREGAPRPVTGLRGLYRREKILSQLTEEKMYSLSWNEKWKRHGDFIYCEWKRK